MRTSGVETMKNLVNQIVFISAFVKDNPLPFNLDRHESLKRVIKDNLGMVYREVDGCLNGTMEKGLMVFVNTQIDINRVVDIADYYNQDSVLLRDSQRQAWLISFGDDKKRIETRLGEFKEITQQQAMDLNSFTKSGEKYYGVIA